MKKKDCKCVTRCINCNGINEQEYKTSGAEKKVVTIIVDSGEFKQREELEYTANKWQNGGGPQLNATNLNNFEKGITQLTNRVNENTDYIDATFQQVFNDETGLVKRVEDIEENLNDETEGLNKRLTVLEEHEKKEDEEVLDVLVDKVGALVGQNIDNRLTTLEAKPHFTEKQIKDFAKEVDTAANEKLIKELTNDLIDEKVETKVAEELVPVKENVNKNEIAINKLNEDLEETNETVTGVIEYIGTPSVNLLEDEMLGGVRPATGLTAKVEANEKTLLTKADKATTLAGYGIEDVKIENGVIAIGSETITPVTDVSDKADKATTLAGYGIEDVKIENGVITIGSETITPLTSYQDISNLATKDELADLETKVTEKHTKVEASFDDGANQLNIKANGVDVLTYTFTNVVDYKVTQSRNTSDFIGKNSLWDADTTYKYTNATFAKGLNISDNRYNIDVTKDVNVDANGQIEYSPNLDVTVKTIKIDTNGYLNINTTDFVRKNELSLATTHLNNRLNGYESSLSASLSTKADKTVIAAIEAKQDDLSKRLSDVTHTNITYSNQKLTQTVPGSATPNVVFEAADIKKDIVNETLRISETPNTADIATFKQVSEYVNTAGGKIDTIQVNNVPVAINNKVVNIDLSDYAKTELIEKTGIESNTTTLATTAQVKTYVDKAIEDRPAGGGSNVNASFENNTLRIDVDGEEKINVTLGNIVYKTVAETMGAEEAENVPTVSIIKSYIENNTLSEAPIEGIQVNGTDVNPSNKIVNLDLSSYATTTDLSSKADKATTLAGYGITDSYIDDNGTIHMGVNSVSPLTEHQDISTLATKEELSEEIKKLEQKTSSLFTYQVVDTLPSINNASLYVVYLVKETSLTGEVNTHREYIVVANGSNRKYEELGSINLDQFEAAKSDLEDKMTALEGELNSVKSMLEELANGDEEMAL